MGDPVRHGGQGRPVLGLLAGSGQFPMLVASGARQAGCRVVVIALRGEADQRLRDLADAFYTSGIVRLGRWIRLFRREGAGQVIMAGRVRKTRVHGSARWLQWLRYLPDWTSIKVWYFASRDKRNDSLLSAVAEQMQQKGLTVIDSTQYCPEAMAPEGVLTTASPTASQHKDIELGWRIAKEMGRLDVGQSVAVKEQDVIAVEAVEGTDAMIARAGELARSGGWTLVKVAKPNQDMRFDVPTVGADTIENLHRAGGRVLVVEAGKTLLIDRDKTVELANRYGIAVIGRGQGTSAGDA
ncbi:MAG TPA: UDP-2,3-diacylglucosamine diphosphatase LpxI [Phycisphaerae bacterium]|nr:UDP-2,3-diacylglucosamine diphosphatase LpxI [Phycisphaerae bacterium]